MLPDPARGGPVTNPANSLLRQHGPAFEKLLHARDFLDEDDALTVLAVFEEWLNGAAPVPVEDTDTPQCDCNVSGHDPWCPSAAPSTVDSGARDVWEVLGHPGDQFGVRPRKNGKATWAELVGEVEQLREQLRVQRKRANEADAVLDEAHAHSTAVGTLGKVIAERPDIAAYRELLHYIYLHVNDAFVMRKLTTEQKELWADAIDACGDPNDPTAYPRWWRDDYRAERDGA